MTKKVTQAVIDAQSRINIAKIKPHVPRIDKLNEELIGIAHDEYKTLNKKLIRIHEIKDELIGFVRPLSCCKSGCSNCCSMAVGISSFDARRIAEATGLEPITVDMETSMKAADDEHIKAKIGVVCPFLRDNKCSIYKVRPLVCQTHFNLSGYVGTCDHKTNPSLMVPNLDFRTLWAVEALMLCKHETMGDIRDYFPQEMIDSWWSNKENNNI